MSKTPKKSKRAKPSRFRRVVLSPTKLSTALAELHLDAAARAGFWRDERE
jgi:hypothetical protein